MAPRFGEDTSPSRLVWSRTLRLGPRYVRSPETATCPTYLETAIAAASKQWPIASGTRTDEMHELLNHEFEAVRKWRADGEIEADAPATPCIDRIQDMCQLANVEYEFYLDTTKVYSDRNSVAHHPPPRLEDYLKPDDTVDWHRVWNACRDFQPFGQGWPCPQPRHDTLDFPLQHATGCFRQYPHCRRNSSHRLYQQPRRRWFLSDFYAFNYLYKGLGASQTWLTAADPYQLLDAHEKHNVYLHGNPFQDRRVVLSREMLDKGKLTPVTVVEPSEMIDCFLQEVTKRSEAAKRENGHLLLLVFCHGLSNFYFLLAGSKGKGLGIVQLKGAVELGARVTLVSTACYSGGWATRVDLNSTAMAAAGPGTESNAWAKSTTLPPLLRLRLRQHPNQGSDLRFERADSRERTGFPQSEDDEKQLQPDEPREEQTKTYNEFCRSVWETCQHRVHRIWDQQEFTFSAKDDQWEHSCMGRTGIPLAHFEARWNLLEPWPCMGKPEDNSPSQDVIAAIRQHRSAELARIWLPTCPGDWTFGQQVALASHLEDCAAGIKGRTSWDWDMMAVIHFRWEQSLLVDNLIDLHNLPRPNNQSFLLWEWIPWQIHMDRARPGWKKHRGIVFGALVDGDFLLTGESNQGPPFH